LQTSDRWNAAMVEKGPQARETEYPGVSRRPFREQ
jgi:hypothetical protein